jgi:hypothetical protein|tara:strand:+ start:107 stop:328 length:222 start_codon:yes stop_codon:yes gene_type:complete
MKVLRIDNQDVINDAVFKNLEDLREQLCDFHSIDWQGDDDIFSLSLDEIMAHGDWDYMMITDKDADEYEDKRY